MTAAASILYAMRILNENSSDACDMLSNPIKAHGDITATLNICEITPFSGTVWGEKPQSCLKTAVKKHVRTAAARKTVMTSKTRAAPFLQQEHIMATASTAATVRRASPIYTS